MYVCIPFVTPLESMLDPPMHTYKVVTQNRCIESD